MGLRLLPFAAILGVVALGLDVDVMEIDAAQYAELARQMLDSGSFLQLKFYAADYLDKPPLVFWTAALSYSLFGVSTVAYKLPSLAFAGLAVASTWRLGSLLYSREVGYAAALLLASCQAFFSMTNDCRTDALLMGSVAAAVWQATAFLQGRGRSHLWLAALAVALAMLAKGPVGLAIPAGALGAHFALRREWGQFARREWAIAGALAAALLAPMLWGLYAQFGWRGLRFYAWDQGFARLTGASPWRDDSTPFYFVSTLAWTFLPWSFLLGLALAEQGKTLVRQRFRLARSQEFISTGGFALTFLALSLLRYKLSHYLYVALPFASLITGQFLVRALREGRPGGARRELVALQGLLGAGLLGAAALLAGHCFGPPPPLVVGGLLLAGGATAALLARGATAFDRAVLSSVAAMLGVNLALNAQVAPALLAYQASSQAGHRVAELGLPRDRLYTYRTRPHALGFYAGEQVDFLASLEAIPPLLGEGALWIYTDEQGLRELRQAGLPIAAQRPFAQFSVSRLSPLFLLPATRALELRRHHLVGIGTPPG